MEDIRSYIAQNMWVRVAILVAAVLLLVVIFIPEHLKSAIMLKAIRYLAIYIPAVILGAVIGWVKYDFKLWWQSTLALIGAAFVFHMIVLLGAKLDEASFSATDQRSTTKVSRSVAPPEPTKPEIPCTTVALAIQNGDSVDAFDAFRCKLWR